MIRKIKLLFVLLLAAILSVVMYCSFGIKEQSIQELYKDVTFMRITLEARQYVGQIEYGIKNGRQLENFYNMQETLQGIQGCSSYMEGVYIVSSSAQLLYQRGIKANKLSLTIPAAGAALKSDSYCESEDSRYFYLQSPVKNAKGTIDGYLVMCISKNAVSNAVADYDKQNMLQSAVIALEIFGIALLAIRRVRPDKNSRPVFRLVLVLSIAVAASVVLDSGMVITRFYQIVNDTARQSANKMAQALQSEVDAVAAKGVSQERIYDLNGWLAQNSSELKIVTSLTLDRNRKISANVSQEYINGFFDRILKRTSMLVVFTLLGGLLACAGVSIPERSRRLHQSSGGLGASWT